MRGDLGPPGRERPGATASTGPIQKSADTTTDKPIICHAGVAEWWRRHRASERLTPLCRCGPDPWTYRCTRPAPSDRWIDAGADAARHIIIATGCAPILRPDTLTALHKRGGDDRALAERLHALTGGTAA